MQKVACQPNNSKPGPLGEAACSMNTYVEVPTLGRVQVTGRGASGLEAAQHLKASVEALQTLYAPAPVPAPPTREARLCALLACGLTKALTASETPDYPLVERLLKAVSLVVRGMVQPGERAGLMAVESDTTRGMWYQIERLQCTCRDFKRHLERGNDRFYCKHVLAVLLNERINAEQGA